MGDGLESFTSPDTGETTEEKDERGLAAETVDGVESFLENLNQDDEVNFNIKNGRIHADYGDFKNELTILVAQMMIAAGEGE